MYGIGLSPVPPVRRRNTACGPWPGQWFTPPAMGMLFFSRICETMPSSKRSLGAGWGANQGPTCVQTPQKPPKPSNPATRRLYLGPRRVAQERKDKSEPVVVANNEQWRDMARTYIHERADWPKFIWDSKGLAPLAFRREAATGAHTREDARLRICFTMDRYPNGAHGRDH